ncbi:MAG: uracil phosphoribosyltransferase [Candidatus Kapaibacterium sp.]
MHTVLSHPLLHVAMSVLRDKESPAAAFREALDRVAYHVCLACTTNLPLATRELSTPLDTTTGYALDGGIVVVPVLRSGLTLLHAFTHCIPEATIGYVGLKRDEETLVPKEYYCNLPTLDDRTTFIVLDPMLATGGSMCAAIDDLKRRGARSIIAAVVLAAPEGIAEVEQAHPDVHVVCAAVDRGLNQHGYIVPGLGDAGDRAHGTV